ncbi:MAG TPA: hypothetical protein PKC49_01530 [Phycisphaerae bacterium]|nr:hypothetical protein [Phycisphaerae bacterium]
MSTRNLRTRPGLFVMGWLLAASALGQTAEQKLHQAYFLEREKRDLAAANALYAEVAADRNADAATRATAQARHAGCSEELRAADLSRLMPAETLAYVELNRPGERVIALLEQLGLLADGQASGELGRRVAISPALVRELIGIRSLAAAVTGFDPAAQRPTGVVVLHPGDVEVIRGLLETALPIGGRAVQPIDGFATYDVEGQVFVTLTARLVIASQQRGEIEGVIERLRHGGSASLADNARVAELLRQRDDALLYFFVNAKPIMPLVNGALAMGGGHSKELALAQALLDLNSLEAIVGRAGIRDDGLFLDASVHLAEGHRNLVYNFVRLPTLDEAALRRVPPGAAALAALAINEPGRAAPRPADGAPPAISALDIGREVFANLTTLALFVLPPEGEGERIGNVRVPDAALVLAVKDPAKSEALWSQALGIASVAMGTGAIEGSRRTIEGESVRTFRLADGVTVYLAASEGELLISPSRSAVARSLAARAAKKTIRDDALLGKGVDALDPHTSVLAMLSVARCAQIARAYAPPSAMTEAEPILETMQNTTAVVALSQSPSALRVRAAVNGLPRVGPLVSRLLRERGELVWARDRHPAEERWAEFQALVVRQDRAAALACGEALLRDLQHDAARLNNCAWAMLTEPQHQGQYDELALRFSIRSNELTDHMSWMLVDTLALARFKAGDVQEAVRLQRTALELVGNGPRRGEVLAALQRYETALAVGDTASR